MAKKKASKTYSKLLVIKDMKIKIKYNFYFSNIKYQKTERMFDASETAVTWAHPYAIIGSMSGHVIWGKQNTLLWEFILKKSLKAQIFLAQRLLTRHYLNY